MDLRTTTPRQPAKARQATVLGQYVPTRFANRCAQCGEALFMPEWSEYLAERRVRHLWECDACGYQFETLVCFPEA
jgi:ribosomal protein S27AE